MPDCDRKHIPCRSKALNDLSRFEIVALLHFDCAVFFILLQNKADKIIRLLRLGLHIFLGGMVGVLERESRRVRTMGYLFQFFPPFRTNGKCRSQFVVRVNRFPVHCHNRRHIVDALHAAFNFQRRNARFDKFGDMVDHTEIFAVKNICAVLIFFHGEILSRTGLFHHGILKPACLDAFAPVGLAFPVCKIIG